MKGKFGVFIFGLFVGALLTVFVFLIYSVGHATMEHRQGVETSTVQTGESNVLPRQIDGLNIFEKDGDPIPAKQVRIFQTLATDCALAEATNEVFEYGGGGYDYWQGFVVLLVSDGSKSFYDDMKIDIPNGMQMVQIGTYRYQTVNKEFDQWKTVPVVVIK